MRSGAEQICGAHQNGDNLGINRAHLRISVHCRVTVGIRVRVSIGVRLGLVRVADFSMRTAGETDKMRISHVIKTGQWRSAPHFVVSLDTFLGAL